MKNIRDALNRFEQALKALNDKPEADSIKHLAINEITRLSKTQIKAFPETALTNEQSSQLAEAIRQLQTGKPVQYVLGRTEFYGLPFIVNPSVLIPRTETEELVRWVIETANLRNVKDTILDIGTGSGCIPISLKKHLPTASISALDISAEALNTAKQNADLNQVEIDFFKCDILNLSQYAIRNTQYSLIISNPPYVTEQEKTDMHANVINYEPHTALFVPDDDPLLFYKAIANFALTHLEPNGLLFFEINENLGNQVIKLLADTGFINLVLKQDMRGMDRMVMAQIG